ncbi:MAG: Abi family protein [bacterium]
MKEKMFKSLDEQIQIFVERGLLISDYEFTRDIILRENYFFLTGYRHIFSDSNNSAMYIKGTTFEELYAVFNFDRYLRNIIFKNILIFENNLKSILSYTVSKNHGYKENNYLNVKIFSRDHRKVKQINDLVKKMKRQITINGRQHRATKHYLDNYGYIPLWIVVKVLSFGITGELYMVLHTADQEEIADLLNTTIENLESFLPILANYRNLCAHEDICFENKTQKAIENTIYHEKLLISKTDGEYENGKHDLFALVIILKEVLNSEDFNMFIREVCYEIDRLEGKLNTIGIDKILDTMGFPDNYMEIVRMD